MQAYSADSFQQFRRTVETRLQRAELEAPGGLTALRLWSYGREAEQSWTVMWPFTSPSGLADKAARLRWMHWDCFKDYGELTDPVLALRRDSTPTLQRQDVFLDRAFPGSLLAQLARVEIPLAYESTGICLDGLANGLETNSVRLCWSNHGPPAWSNLDEWFTRTISRLEELRGCAILSPEP